MDFDLIKYVVFGFIGLCALYIVARSLRDAARSNAPDPDAFDEEEAVQTGFSMLLADPLEPEEQVGVTADTVEGQGTVRELIWRHGTFLRKDQRRSTDEHGRASVTNFT
ncbi:MAG: hypothetical protein KC620_21490, partial [Myxococcales bacterium]|nr:hypothetical protein [Myxococcales bacterium]